jgi:hypothetical protein
VLKQQSFVVALSYPNIRLAVQKTDKKRLMVNNAIIFFTLVVVLVFE